jgi:hypothetical protein
MRVGAWPPPYPCLHRRTAGERMWSLLSNQVGVYAFVFARVGNTEPETFGARGLAMLGETIRRSRGDGRPAHRQHLTSGPLRETSAHATLCRKTPYARRKTRTPRPWGQGVHSELVGAPVSRAPLEVVRAEQTSNRKLGFGSLGGLDDPSWDAKNSDFDPKAAGRSPRTTRTSVQATDARLVSYSPTHATL